MNQELLYPRRCLAFFIDALLSLAPLWLLSPIIIVLWQDPAVSDQLAARALLLVAPLPSIVIYLLSQIVQISRNRPTVGRRIAGIKIITTTEETGLLIAMKREVLGVFLPLGAVAVSGLWPLLLIVPLWSLVDPRGRSFPDLVAGTRVARLPISERHRELPWEASLETRDREAVQA